MTPQITVIRNAHTVAEQRAIGDRWAEHKGPRMTLQETLDYEQSMSKQAVINNALSRVEADEIIDRGLEKGIFMTMDEMMAHAAQHRQSDLVLVNSMSQEEADRIADELFSRPGTSITLEEAMAYSAPIREAGI